jgi:hypothetical protein
MYAFVATQSGIQTALTEKEKTSQDENRKKAKQHQGETYK